MMLKVVERAMGKDGMTGKNQLHLDLCPGVFSELNNSKLRPLPSQCLSSS